MTLKKAEEETILKLKLESRGKWKKKNPWFTKEKTRDSATRGNSTISTKQISSDKKTGNNKAQK